MSSVISVLKPISNPRLFRKDTIVLFQGEVPRGVYVVLDGVVRAYSITSSGEERTISLYTKGDILPLAWALGDAPTSFLHYVAMSDVRTLEIKRTAFQQAITKNKALTQHFLHVASNNYASLLLRVTGLSQSRAIEKIAYTMYYLLFRYGLDRGDEQYELNLKLSQGMIASLIGQTRESTARNLKTLKENGSIDYNGSTYTVNKTRLEQFIGEDTFRDLVPKV